MAMSLEDFLTKLNLDQYIVNFQNSGLTNVLSVDDDVLQDIGIDKIGHRKRIMNSLETLHKKENSNSPESEVQNGNNQDDVSGDEPPPLPPKSRIASPPSILNTGPLRSKHDARNNSVGSERPRPVKPPRNFNLSFKEKGQTLPAGFKSPPYGDYKLLSPQKEKTPPVPPRSDLGEEKTQIKLESDDCTTENTVKTSATNNVDILSKKQPLEDSSAAVLNKELNLPAKPIPPARPSRLSMKKLQPVQMIPKPEIAPTPEEVNEEEEPIAPPRRSSRAGHVEKRSFQSLTSPVLSPNIDIDILVDFSEDDLSGDEPSALLEDDVIEDKPQDSFTLSMVKDKEQFMCIVGQNKLKSKRDKKEDRKSRFLLPGKNGYLCKRGGQKGDKTARKRWIEFDGKQLSYFKDKGGDPKQIIPVSRMTDVELEPNARKPTFHLLTPNRRFTFIEPSGKADELTIWVSILMEAILHKDESEVCKIGGSMAEPNKEGWLLKQGHNLLQDFNKRYVAIKDDKLCYYYTFDDFCDDLPINRLEMALVSLKEDHDKQRLLLHTNKERTFVFEADDLKSHISWKSAIERSIQIGLGNSEFLQQIQENHSNKKCADCDDKDPIYASVNLLVVVCAECIGCHRFLGTQVSKTKSILMDEKVWSPSLIKLFQTIGNSSANTLWTSKLPSDDKIKPDTDRILRQEFITVKYQDKRYFQWSEMFGYPDELGMALRKSVVTENVLETLKLIISGADVYYIPEDSEDTRTPYELASEAGMNLQMELLLQYGGHLSLEEREIKNSEPYDGLVNLSAEDLGTELDLLPKIPDISSPQYEKSGVLLIRTTRNETWKDKMFTLQGRKLKYVKGVKPEETEILDLTQIDELEYGQEDAFTINLKIAGRTYFLKAHLPEEADSWYKILKNKQVMGVPIECQECNEKGLPYLIEKCTAFVERNALLMEGIYRLSGSQTVIKRLAHLFNQDAPGLRLNIDDYPDVHAVAGLLKQYLRELPEPLLTTKLYHAFTSNAYKTADAKQHNEKLYRYKELLQLLPKTNYLSLRSIMMHLTQIIKVADRNKMVQRNVVVLFGPILLSCGNTMEQSWLNAEYDVLSDLLDYDYYIWLFEVSESEIKAMDAMIDIVKKTDEMESDAKPQQMVIESMQITILVNNTEDVMKMTNQTTPSAVCLFAIEKHHLSVDGNWALFEVHKDGVYERPVHSKEPVLQLAMNVGGESDLVIKENYVAEKISPFQSANLGVSGNLHYAKEKWLKNCFVEVKTGNIKVYKKKGSKEEDNIAIHDIVLFLGVDQKKKPPEKSRFGFKLRSSEGVIRYFCSDNEVEINMFIAAILNIRYPTGLWITLHAETKDNSKIRNSEIFLEPEPYWGRASTYVRASGTSQRLMDQLQRTRHSLKKQILKR